MSTLRWILGDQLSTGISSLAGGDPSRDVVLMVEVAGEATYVPHHKQKLVLLFSAMRHFAAQLREAGWTVDYVELDDPLNTQSFEGELRRAVKRCADRTAEHAAPERTAEHAAPERIAEHAAPERIVVTEPGEWRVKDMLEQLDTPLHVLPDDRFFCTHERFKAWASGRKTYRMEYFYREMRRETGYLMNGDEPEGGQWNYDADNRKALPANVRLPERQRFTPNATTRRVMSLVEEHFPSNFGELDTFGWPVTRSEALAALDDFIAHALPRFGDYQDAMKNGNAFLFHALLSPCLNCGLLTPREVCDRAQEAWRDGRAPLAATEGFIRQILGWREYIRGMYWFMGPEYGSGNFLHAERPLPAFYWTAHTDMACLRDAVEQTRRHAYAHHIQRLMITGNFALLAGIDPQAVQEWYLAVYADAYEWVELPNTHGMALFADGGVIASKPYAASGAYINRMSDHCAQCRFKVKEKTGPSACPFNYLYWYFLMQQEERLAGNPRMAMPYRTLGRMTAERQQDIVDSAEQFLASLEEPS